MTSTSRPSSWSAIRLRAAFGAPLLVLALGCAAEVDPDPDGLGTPTPPFAVSSYFAPSGYMGDGADGVALVADSDPSACAPRPDGARGDCYRFDYQPGDLLWAGVYWQYPADNWGASEGVAVAPGTTRVSFLAASGGGGETLTLQVGGIDDPALPYRDELAVSETITLTTELTRHEVSLAGQTYDKVIGGFAWSLGLAPETDPASAPPVVLYLDDVVWE